MSISREQGETINKCKKLHNDKNRKSPLPCRLCVDVDHGELTSKNKKDKYSMIQSVECIMERVHSNELSLGNNILDHMTMNISQTKVTPLIAVGQLSMVNSE